MEKNIQLRLTLYFFFLLDFITYNPFVKIENLFSGGKDKLDPFFPVNWDFKKKKAYVIYEMTFNSLYRKSDIFPKVLLLFDLDISFFFFFFFQQINFFNRKKKRIFSDLEKLLFYILLFSVQTIRSSTGPRYQTTYSSIASLRKTGTAPERLKAEDGSRP